MAERNAGTKNRWGSATRKLGAIAALAAALGGGCAGRYRGPRTLAAVGTILVGSGGGTWVAGEKTDERAMTTTGFALVALGMGIIVASGGWMASSAACTADPDCAEAEQCREIPAPPGGIPYRQCVPR